MMFKRALARVLIAGGVTAASAVAPAQQNSSNYVRLDTVVIELNRFGFFPAEVTHTASRHVIFVNNVTGLQNLTLLLKDGNGQSVKQPAVTTFNPSWRDILDLHPGKYTLTEANHPTWTCTIQLK